MRPHSSKSTKINWDGFAAALLAKPEKRPPGEGWMTTVELMKKFKTTDKQILRALKATPHETFTGYINLNGKLSRAVWHRPL